MCSTRVTLGLSPSPLPSVVVGKAFAHPARTLLPHHQLRHKLRKPQGRALSLAVLAKERVILVDTHITPTTSWKDSKYANPVGIIVLLVAAFASVAPIFYNRWKRQQRQKMLIAKRGAPRSTREPSMETELEQLMATLSRGKPGQISFRGPGQVQFHPHPTSSSGSKVAIFLSGLNSSEFDQYSTSTNGEEVVKRYLSWAANGKGLKAVSAGMAGAQVVGKQMVGSS